MKRYFLYVLTVFLAEALILALLQDRPLLAGMLPEQDTALTWAFAAAWPLALAFALLRRKPGGKKRKGKRKSGPRKTSA